MAANQIIDLYQLYKKTFGNTPYHVPELAEGEKAVGELYHINSAPSLNVYAAKGGIIKEDLNGVEIILPVRFYIGPTLLMYMPYVVVKISNKKVIVKTPMNERKGTVKEQYSIDDYVIGVKGFLIGEDRQFPEDELEKLKVLYETGQAVTLDNALTNIFLTDPELGQEEQRRVVVEDLDISEVQGGRVHVRPFSMSLVSDSVFTLEYED
jgi:hypothetical protein